jgi:hypothetical protein
MEEDIGPYMSTKKPASDRHFTSVVVASFSRKLLQWKKAAKPPAEFPDKSAYNTDNITVTNCIDFLTMDRFGNGGAYCLSTQ